MRRRWKILIAFAIILLAFSAICLIPPWYRVEAYKKLLIAGGEKLEISELVPPPVPPGQNGAEILIKAFGLINSANDDYSNLPPAMRMVAPGKAMVCFKQPDVRSDYATNSWSNVIAAAEADRPMTELLRKAANFPVINFHPDYENEIDTNRWQVWSCVLRLSADVLCDLHNNDTASATTNLLAMVALVNGERDERIVISQEGRITMASLATCTCWELLQSTNLNDEKLATLQKKWKQLQFIQEAKNAILMERALLEYVARKMRSSQEYFNEVTDMGFFEPSNIWGDTKKVGIRFNWDFRWSCADELLALKGYQETLGAFRSVQSGRTFYSSYTNMSAQFAKLGNPDWGEDGYMLMDLDLPRLFSRMVPDSAHIFYRTMVAETSKQMVITAIALKRYQLKNGAYPSALSDLVPEFLSSVPLDPVDSKPLRYRRNPDGTFLLYSIGFNGKDDGGNPAVEKKEYLNGGWPPPHSLDWVWPQPATPAEIQYFYEHPPKPW